MWEFDNGLLPNSFDTLFRYVKDVHKFNLRSSKNNEMSENIKINTESYGRNSIRFQGPKILNTIKKLPFFNETKTKKQFSQKLKLHLINLY